MSSTPIGTSTPYCSPAELIQYHDLRQLGQVLNDDGTTIATTQGVQSSGIVQKALMAASGEVESWLRKADRYQVADLQNLTGASKELLCKLTAEIAFWFLYCRRHQDAEPNPGTAWAFTQLEAMSKGQNLLGLQEVANADLPQTQYLSGSNYQQQNLATTQARRLYGSRGWNRIPGPFGPNGASGG